MSTALGRSRTTSALPIRKYHLPGSLTRGSNIKAWNPLNMSSSRNEMPNKYQSICLPKVKIEDVYITNFLSNNQTLNEDIKVPRSPQSQFYYDESNEIISLESFFHVHKNLEVHRKKQERVKSRIKLKEKVQKIEDLRTATSFSQRRVLPLNFDQSIIENSASSPKAYYLNSSRFRLDPDKESSMGSGKRDPSMAELSARKMEEGLNSSIEENKTLDLGAPQQEKKDFVKRRLVIKSPPPQREMATEQKFTEKEVQKHLFQMSLFPKRMKNSPVAPQIESNYIKMFKSPRVMEFAVDKCIQKGKNIISKKEQTPGSNLLKGNVSRVVSPKAQTRVEVQQHDQTLMMNTSSIPVSPNGQKEVGKAIEESIQNINHMLRRGHQVLPLADKSKYVPRIIRAKNKHGLKFDTGHSNLVREMMEQHRSLSAKIKKMNQTFVKEHGPSAVKNQSYVSYYN